MPHCREGLYFRGKCMADDEDCRLSGCYADAHDDKPCEHCGGVDCYGECCEEDRF